MHDIYDKLAPKLNLFRFTVYLRLLPIDSRNDTAFSFNICRHGPTSRVPHVHLPLKAMYSHNIFHLLEIHVYIFGHFNIFQHFIADNI